MDSVGRTQRSSLLAWTFWAPLASLVAVEIYARAFDGWGAWATAPLFLLPALLALVITLVGLRDLYSRVRAGGTVASTLLQVTVAACPIVWLMIRRHVIS